MRFHQSTLNVEHKVGVNIKQTSFCKNNQNNNYHAL